MRFLVAILILLCGLFGAASHSFAVVLSTDEEMYHHELSDAKARAQDFERLEKQRRTGHTTEGKEIDQYHEKENAELKLQEREREQYVRSRDTRPKGESEDVLEERWNAEAAKLEAQHDKERASYISTQHRAEIAINESPDMQISPMREYDLTDPKSPALTDYLKAHPVKDRKQSEKIAPDGSIVSPGAKQISSPPPGGDSSLGF